MAFAPYKSTDKRRQRAAKESAMKLRLLNIIKVINPVAYLLSSTWIYFINPELQEKFKDYLLPCALVMLLLQLLVFREIKKTERAMDRKLLNDCIELLTERYNQTLKQLHKLNTFEIKHRGQQFFLPTINDLYEYLFHKLGRLNQTLMFVHTGMLELSVGQISDVSRHTILDFISNYNTEDGSTPTPEDTIKSINSEFIKLVDESYEQIGKIDNILLFAASDIPCPQELSLEKVQRTLDALTNLRLDIEGRMKKLENLGMQEAKNALEHTRKDVEYYHQLLYVPFHHYWKWKEILADEPIKTLLADNPLVVETVVQNDTDQSSNEALPPTQTAPGTPIGQVQK